MMPHQSKIPNPTIAEAWFAEYIKQLQIARQGEINDPTTVKCVADYLKLLDKNPKTTKDAFIRDIWLNGKSQGHQTTKKWLNRRLLWLSLSRDASSPTLCKKHPKPRELVGEKLVEWLELVQFVPTYRVMFREAQEIGTSMGISFKPNSPWLTTILQCNPRALQLPTHYQMQVHLVLDHLRGLPANTKGRDILQYQRYMQYLKIYYNRIDEASKHCKGDIQYARQGWAWPCLYSKFYELHNRFFGLDQPPVTLGPEGDWHDYYNRLKQVLLKQPDGVFTHWTSINAHIDPELLIWANAQPRLLEKRKLNKDQIFKIKQLRLLAYDHICRQLAGFKSVNEIGRRTPTRNRKKKVVKVALTVCLYRPEEDQEAHNKALDDVYFGGLLELIKYLVGLKWCVKGKHIDVYLELHIHSDITDLEAQVKTRLDFGKVQAGKLHFHITPNYRLKREGRSMMRFRQIFSAFTSQPWDRRNKAVLSLDLDNFHKDEQADRGFPKLLELPDRFRCLFNAEEFSQPRGHYVASIAHYNGDFHRSNKCEICAGNFLLMTSAEDPKTQAAIEMNLIPLFSSEESMEDWAEPQLKDLKEALTKTEGRDQSYGIDEKWLHEVVYKVLSDGEKWGGRPGIQKKHFFGTEERVRSWEHASDTPPQVKGTRKGEAVNGNTPKRKRKAPKAKSSKNKSGGSWSNKKRGVTRGE